MRRRVLANTAAAVFLSCLLVPLAAEESSIRTNAQGGVFASDMRFWFSVPDGQRLRLRVNGNETYRGSGPASSTLTARPGEDRSYELSAERRSAPPSDELLESRSFIVRIDAQPPASVVVSGERREADASWSLRFTAEAQCRVFALVDADSYLSSYADVERDLSFKARRVEGLAWSVDGAGNVSPPAAFSFKPFSLSIANPSEGAWANKQRLIVLEEGASEVYWSVDGSDPLEGGAAYEGPVLIDKAGSVQLRVAAKSPDGRIERREIAYSAGSAEPEAAGAIRGIEAGYIDSVADIAVPAGYRWDIGTTVPAADAAAGQLAFEGGKTIALRSIPAFRRYVPFYLSNGKGTLRFVFSLGNAVAGAAAAGPSPATSSEQGVPSPAEFGSGRARAIVWERRLGLVRYRWDGGADWTDAVAPVQVPAAGGRLEWIVDKGASVEGPFSKSFAAAAPEASFPSALPSPSASAVTSGSVSLAVPPGFDGVRFSLSTDSGSTATRTIELPEGAELPIDVCDGEQLSWSVSGAGESLSGVIDRRPPSAPQIEAPDEGTWVRDLPAIRFRSSEKRIEATARWKDEDGRTGSYPLGAAGRLKSIKRGPVEYLIEARAVDSAGNAGAAVSRRFIVDEATVYVSGGDAAVSGDGSRARPYASLSDALSLARSLGHSRVWISGRVSMTGRVELFDGVSVEGGYGSDWKKGPRPSEIALGGGASLHSTGGTVRLSDLTLIESGRRTAPLLSIESGKADLSSISVQPIGAALAPVLSIGGNASVDARDCLLLGGSPVVDVRDSTLSMRECLVSGSSVGSDRLVLMRSAGSRVSLDSTRLDGRSPDASSSVSVVVGLELSGGELALNRSVLLASAAETATGLVARGSVVRSLDSQISSESSRYASAVSLEGGRALVSGGRFSASSRDAVALIVNETESAAFKSSVLSVAGSGIVRAVQVRGDFPDFDSCRFVSGGGSDGSEAFAGDPPLVGSVRGNRFSGFSYLFNRIYDSDSLARFNSRYAGKGPANSIEKPDGM